MPNQELNTTIQCATDIINNFIKVRNYVERALADEKPILCEDRNQYTDEELLAKMKQLVEMFPEVDWDEENVADALFCEISRVHNFVQKRLKENFGQRSYLHLH